MHGVCWPQCKRSVLSPSTSAQKLIKSYQCMGFACARCGWRSPYPWQIAARYSFRHGICIGHRDFYNPASFPYFRDPGGLFNDVPALSAIICNIRRLVVRDNRANTGAISYRAIPPVAPPEVAPIVIAQDRGCIPTQITRVRDGPNNPRIIFAL